MNDQDEAILLDSFKKCMLKEFNEDVIYYIQDLELLIERHTQQRYGEEDYKIGFYSKKLYYYTLRQEEADSIVFFLCFLLFNFPDRAGYTAHAIKKCYGYEILDVCCNGIRIYMNKDDFATINLIEFILNSMQKEEIPEIVWEVFNSVIKNGLPYSIEYLKERIGDESK